MATETTLYARNLMLDALGADFYVALFSATPDETGGGTEIANGGYARLQALFGAASGGGRSNSTSIVFEPQVANWAVSAVGVFDALTGGNLLGWQTVTRTIEPGQQYTIPANGLRIAAA